MENKDDIRAYGSFIAWLIISSLTFGMLVLFSCLFVVLYLITL